MNLFDTCQLFLIPATIFFGALGLAPKEPLKFAVSFMGLVITIVWFVCMVSTAFDEGQEIWWFAQIICVFFILIWFVCVLGHGSLALNERIKDEKKSNHWREWIEFLEGYG